MRHLPADVVTAKRWLLPGDPDRVDAIVELLELKEDYGHAREFRMAEGSYNGKLVGVCSTGIGGPSTAIAAHELHNLGATHMVRVGTCGSLKPFVKVGHVCVADWAVGPRQVHQKATLVEKFDGDWVGPTFSTDWFYPDAKAPVPEDAISVEMEAATLFYVANKLGFKAGCVCACSDEGNTTKYEAGIGKAILSALEGIT